MNAQKHQIIIERPPETRNRYGLPRSTFHSRIKEGLIPPPISLGNRAVGYPSFETDLVLAAMIAGQSKDEIKALVALILEQRKALGAIQ